MHDRQLKERLRLAEHPQGRLAMGTTRWLGARFRGATMAARTGAMVAMLAVMPLTGCTSTTPAAPTVAETATPSVKVVIFNPATSGKSLAAKITARAKAAGMKVTGVECKDFPDIKVGTATDCQLRENGAKKGVRATFTLRTGHYVLKTQQLTW